MTSSPPTGLAAEWLAAWNALDTDRVTALLAPDVVFRSRNIRRVLGGDVDVLVGRDAVLAYFVKAASAAAESPAFELIAAIENSRDIVVEYTRGSGSRCCERFQLDSDGRITDGTAYYF